jgi:hypothetical protein
MRDYVTGFSPWNWEIDSSQTWDVSMKLYQNIVVKKGVTLTIKKEIQMVSQAKIIIERGAKISIDGGLITSERYYARKWKGIKCHKAGQNAKGESGKVEFLNGGKVTFGKIK